MTDFFQARGFTVRPALRNSAARRDVVLAEIESASQSLQSGDMFLFYYSGHGAEQPSADSDEVKDQVLLTYDAPIVDDMLGALWPRFAEGVRIVVITDCCNSGSNVRKLIRKSGQSRKIGKSEPLHLIGLNKRVTQKRTRDGNIQGLQASLLHFAAAQDPELAQDIGRNGLFTHMFLSAWAADYRASYDQLFTRTAKTVTNRQSDQRPRMTLYGFDQESFRRQVPFQPTAAWPPTL